MRGNVEDEIDRKPTKGVKYIKVVSPYCQNYDLISCFSPGTWPRPGLLLG